MNMVSESICLDAPRYSDSLAWNWPAIFSINPGGGWSKDGFPSESANHQKAHHRAP